MSAYVRPALHHRQFRDAAGTPIPYGRRWRDLDGPPEETYSISAHPERFAPLHDVADALVEHLTATFDVSVDEAPAQDLRTAGDPLRTAHLRPARDDAAPLTITWTDLPGVLVQAGLQHHDMFPGCACDACDEAVEDSADDLERLVLDVAAGRFREWVHRTWPGARDLWVGSAVGWGDATRGSEGRRRRRRLPRAEVRLLRGRLRALPDGTWQPWPRRGAPPAP